MGRQGEQAAAGERHSITTTYGQPAVKFSLWPSPRGHTRFSLVALVSALCVVGMVARYQGKGISQGYSDVAHHHHQLTADPGARRLRSFTVEEGLSASYPWFDTSLSSQKRAALLVKAMSLEEKAAQMNNDAPAVERLHLPGYGWWSEALHGVAWAGEATVFPQAIGMAASFDPELLGEVGTAVSDEGRAKYHDYLRQQGKDTPGFYGITFFAPNINMFRDPRWGRGQETYGEDPKLTSDLVRTFLKGMQGDHDRYIKALATCKHFQGYGIDSEPPRLQFDAHITVADMEQYHNPPFEACIRDAGVGSVMCAYNALAGVPMCAHPDLQAVLRDRWNFGGFVVSDCSAIGMMNTEHHYANSTMEAAALAVRAGTDLCCGNEYLTLPDAVRAGLITEDEIDISLTRLMEARIRLGMFDPQHDVPYSNIPMSVVDSHAHRQLALRAAREGLVLLRNEGGALPIDLKATGRIAVIGPNANITRSLVGNYNGCQEGPDAHSLMDKCRLHTVLDAVQATAVASGVTVDHVRGCSLLGNDTSEFDAAALAAKKADVVVLVMGLCTNQVGGGSCPESEGRDRNTLNLPGVQHDLIRRVVAANPRTVLVLMNGGPVTVSWEAEHVPAIIEAWYPGVHGGSAVSDAIFGVTNTFGKMPVTVYASDSQLPPIEDYNMATTPGRTYMYLEQPPLYRFGYGLSYSSWSYTNLQVPKGTIPAAPGHQFTVSVDLSNGGTMDGEEVVQVYYSVHLKSEGHASFPRWKLMGFTRASVSAGGQATVRVALSTNDMKLVDKNGSTRVLPAVYSIAVGGCSPGDALGAPWDMPQPLVSTITLA